MGRIIRGSDTSPRNAAQLTMKTLATGLATHFNPAGSKGSVPPIHETAYAPDRQDIGAMLPHVPFFTPRNIRRKHSHSVPLGYGSQKED